MASTLGQVIKRIRDAEPLILTKRIDRWLVDHPEGIVLDQAAWPILKELTGPSANSQREARFGSSNRGTCLRQQVFRFLGMPTLMQHDPVLQNLFNDGTWRHIRWQMMGVMAGVFTGVEVPAAMPQYSLTTSLDGENASEDWNFELKGTSNFSRIIHEGISEGHNLQVHTAMLATGRDTTVFVAEDKRTQNWKEIVLHRDPKVIAQVKEELNRVNDSIEDRELPAIQGGCRTRTSAEYKKCPFRKGCLSQSCWPEQRVWTS